ncbi:hypothetical protein K490DRAFT_70161 [Saccharata proteae CBS 121410]|uniref:Ribonuclease P/MRP protein subunit POP5 n=1 Tax=Saccharata proteae CBS 121410 TaxID=1314787 RepID=A0A9P4LVK9_9PEZI|nr:hypothetical protein K490DRAFT_70161 [Saccharata proteae CBS 121410]
MVRLKHRYLLVNFLYPQPDSTPPKPLANLPDLVRFHHPSSDKLNPGLLLKLIRETLVDLFGDYGAGMCGGTLQVKYLSPATSTAIIRVSRDHYRMLWAALTYITRLPHPIGQECVVHVVRVSGTIRKAEEEAIRRAKQSVLRAQQEAGGSNTALDALMNKPTGLLRPGDDDAPMTGLVDDESDG